MNAGFRIGTTILFIVGSLMASNAAAYPAMSGLGAQIKKANPSHFLLNPAVMRFFGGEDRNDLYHPAEYKFGDADGNPIDTRRPVPRKDEWLFLNIGELSCTGDDDKNYRSTATVMGGRKVIVASAHIFVNRTSNGGYKTNPDGSPKLRTDCVFWLNGKFPGNIKLANEQVFLGFMDSVDAAPGTFVTVKNANVRAGPSTDEARLTTLPRGTRVTVLERVRGGRWLRVGRGGRALGYVYAPLVRSGGVANFDSQNDWAVIKLRQKVKIMYEDNSWRSISSSQLLSYRNKTYNVGFHIDRDNGGEKMISKCRTFKRKSGSIFSEQKNIYLHNCTTKEMASGSGIFIKPDPKNLHVFVGIHVSHFYASGTKDGDPHSIYNNSGLAIPLAGKFLKRFLWACGCGN